MADLGKYEDIKESLRVRLVDAAANADVLRHSVCEQVGCGYALVAYIKLPSDEQGEKVANVPKGLAQAEKMSEREIMADAMLGSCAAELPRLTHIEDTLFGHEADNLLTGGELRENAELLVLTAGDGLLGAAALYYPGMRERLGKLMGDYWVLPSSVHEVLVMPDRGDRDARELAEMVRDINGSEVVPSERLGNRVLHWRGDLRKLEIAADADRMKEKEPER